MSNYEGAFVPGSDIVIAGAAEGPLKGLTLAVKDLFDLAGHVTGCGNPDWARSHTPALRHARAVQLLLDAGAEVVGKTITDEISLGLLGRNQFEGTPLNPKAPDRVPGGSSSGSASAVASGKADIALGTDSGGSVRTPASFTGIYGLRPTLGRIPIEGMMVQSPSFDTVGFFCRHADLLPLLGDLLLDVATRVEGKVESVLVATDAFALGEGPIAASAPLLTTRLDRLGLPWREISLAEGRLATWVESQRLLQMAEFGATFAPWVDRCVPRFSIEVGRSLTMASLLDQNRLPAARAVRAEVKARLDTLLEGRHLICIPTTPILPPPRDDGLADMRRAVDRITEMTSIAGLTGLPQINLPLGEAGGIPFGLSLIGWRGGDEVLLDMARRLEAAA
ncbi:amidase [Arboricoccus pini]|uniref:Amidase n=1 Tax=Arboricoccus pini TaxID=1963835 RepID=A0A212RSD0_9PROT|nr:amidase [Arboricoccus pini]SNB75413.1 amidase [Arboricoccus pini]